MWNNEEAFTKDLYAFSENQMSPQDEPEPLPITIAQWGAVQRSNREQSIFDTIPVDTDVTFVSSGRGRGRVSVLHRPGASVPYGASNDDDDIRRRLQEVNSHCYSNVNIETQLRVKNGYCDSNQFCDAIEPSVSPKEEIEQRSNSSNSKEERVNVSPVPVLPLSKMRQKARDSCKPLNISEKLYSQVVKHKK